MSSIKPALRVRLGGGALFVLVAALIAFRGDTHVRTEPGMAKAAAAPPRERIPALSASDVGGPLCAPSPRVYCFRDTAFVRSTSLPGYPDWVMATAWIWFGVARDSIEFSVPAPPDAAITTSLGQEHDSLNNTTSYFRRRLRSDGAIYLDLIMNVDGSLGGSPGDSVQYTLEVRRFGSDLPPALRPTGQRALLVALSSRKTTKFSIVPLSLANSIQDLSAWGWFGGAYKVALVADSLYQLCRIPCGSPDTVKLTPSAKVAWRY